MTQDSITLTRRQIRKVLLRHRGSMAEIAKSLSIDPINISQYLKGTGRSQRVAGACLAKAKELLQKEEAARLAKGEANGVSVRAALSQLRSKSDQSTGGS